ncbi:MAG: flagellar hook capping FlgD N-terminal domain-containing protein [Pseudomonadota bacterium]
MEISPIAPPTVNSTNASSQANAVLSSDFETFLQMLTAQARYQDPLEPIDSTEYAAQLAQFSMVEQQVMSNSLLTALMAQLGSNSMAQMASWIGMDARTTAPNYFSGDPIEIEPRPTSGAEAVSLIVYDENDLEVQRLTLPVSNTTIEWNGLQDDNTPFPDGLYRFEVESRAGGEVIGIQKVATYSRVSEARLENGETILVLSGGVEIPARDVTGLREGQSL